MPLKKRRKPSIAAGISGSRASLIADIQADSANIDQLNRQKEADEKRLKAETWAKEGNRLKELAQRFQDGEVPLSDFNKELDGSASKFSDNSGEIESLRRAAIRNRDTQTYNNYINGAIDFESFEDFAKLRQKDGGDLSHLSQLVAQARGNEDKVQYSNYQAGILSYDQFRAYAGDRAKGGGDISKLNGYIALAKTNENKIQDQLKGTQYNAGQLSDEDYEAYLTNRVKDAVDPTEASQLRVAIKTVQNNSVLKRADDVRAEYEMGEIDGGTAAARLIGIRSSSNDASVQKSISTLLGQIQAADKAAAKASAGSASATVTKVQNDLNTAVNQSQADYDKEMSNLQTKTGKAGIADWAPMSDQAWVATTLFKGTLATASKNSPDPIWEAEHGNHLKGVEALFSNKLFQLATTIAENMTKPAINEQTGVNLTSVGDAAKFLIMTAAADSRMDPMDRLNLIKAGQVTLETGLAQWAASSDGVRFRDFVDNRTNELMANGGAGKKVLAEMLDVPEGAVDKALVQSLLLNSPDKVRSALTQAGVPQFADTVVDTKQGLRNLVPGQTSDEFSKSIADITAAFRALNDANNDIKRQTGVYGLNAIQTATEAVIHPDFEGWLHSTDAREAHRTDAVRGGPGDPNAKILQSGNNYDMEAERLGNVNRVDPTPKTGPNLQQLGSRQYDSDLNKMYDYGLKTSTPVNIDQAQRAGERATSQPAAVTPVSYPAVNELTVEHVQQLLTQRQLDAAAPVVSSGLSTPSSFQLKKVAAIDEGKDPYAQEATKYDETIAPADLPQSSSGFKNKGMF